MEMRHDGTPMSWIKVDDQFADHPKVIAAGPLAAWLYVCGLTYAGRYLTDGFIPAGQVRKLADIDNATELAERLVSVNLWETIDGGYHIHDYLVYNPSGEQVRTERRENAKHQADWRAAHRGKKGRYEGDTDAGSNDGSNDGTTGLTTVVNTTAPSPSPSPSPSRTPSEETVAPPSEFAEVAHEYELITGNLAGVRAQSDIKEMADAHVPPKWIPEAFSLCKDRDDVRYKGSWVRATTLEWKLHGKPDLTARGNGHSVDANGRWNP
jgi:hypothetical protein